MDTKKIKRKLAASPSSITRTRRNLFCQCDASLSMPFTLHCLPLSTWRPYNANAVRMEVKPTNISKYTNDYEEYERKKRKRRRAQKNKKEEILFHYYDISWYK